MERTEQNLVVVLGMHRSGTSAITRGLRVLGVDLGDRLEPPASGINEKGYWEDIDIVALNVEMLGSIGSDWHCVSPIQANDIELLRSRGYLLRAIELLRLKQAQMPFFGFKDPRVAKILPFWKQAFIAGEFNVRFVLTIRNPLSVVKSLAKRNDFEPEKSYLLWADHVITSLTQTATDELIVVDYDYLLQNPELEIKRMAKFLNAEIDSAELEIYKTEFLDEALRHSIYRPNDLLIDSAAPPLVQEIYSTLLDLAAGLAQHNGTHLTQQIIQWKEEYHRASAALQLIDNSFKRIAVSRAEIVGQNEKIEILNRLFAERGQHIERLTCAASESEQRIAELTHAASASEQRIAELTHAASASEQRIAELTHTASASEQRILDLTRAASENGQRAADLTRTVSKLNQRVANTNQHIESLLTSIAEIRNSRSWRITVPLRAITITAQRTAITAKLLPNILKKGGGLWSTSQMAIRILLKEGLTGVKLRLRGVALRSSDQVATELAKAMPTPNFSIVPHYVDPNIDESEKTLNHKATIGIHIHLFYIEMLGEFVSRLQHLNTPFDLYISAPQNSDISAIAANVKTVLPQVEKIVVEVTLNRGRDIAPLIIQFGSRLAEYGIIGHFHTKKSPHNNNLEHWCTNILDLLLGAPHNKGGQIRHIINLLQGDANVVYPEGQSYIIKDPTGWADNYGMASQLLERFTNISIGDFPIVEFPEGSMFWARGACLKEYLSLPLTYEDFAPEPIPADGTLAHALERLILIFASRHEGRHYRIHKSDSIADYRYYEEQHDYSSSIVQRDIQILSYYLPQFHPIPENDLWHGQGFTEWTKVRAANPLFEGHYQQHIPHHDLGYYLLDTPETLKKQAEMMRQAGVRGQIFYHYWFDGKLILEEPARMLLENPGIDMPFCFCWANENWTRRWDGNEKEILLSQNYSADDARAFIRYLIPFFHDPRYIRIDNRPVLQVYRASSIPDAKGYMAIWGEECAAAGIPRPYVIAVLTRGATDPNDFGMDAGVERVLHDWTAGAAPEIKNNLRHYHEVNGSVLSYNDVANFYASQTDTKSFTYFRSLVPIWDNTARYGSEAFLVHGSTPPAFQTWLEKTIDFTKEKLPEDRRFIIINAWNEWAEGAHLEPDSRFGYSYLNSVGRALSNIKYGSELSYSYNTPRQLKLHLSFTEFLAHQLQSDADLKSRFLACVARSTIFEHCLISTSAPDLLNTDISCTAGDSDSADFVIEFRRTSFFDSTAIERMLQMASQCRGSIVIPNFYDSHPALPQVFENGSVLLHTAHPAPLLIIPTDISASGYKNIRICAGAQFFAVHPNSGAFQQQPAVTTIIRFHKTARITELRKALYCLAAMRDCVVTPLIAAQDLDDAQQLALEQMLSDIPFASGVTPKINRYNTPGGKGDLRSKMLNESVKQAPSKYVAFLDYDDLLMPHAYSWLIQRLQKTGKAVSFGRVYATTYDGKRGLMLDRNRTYEYGYSYEEFVRLNHAPLHSFMIDLTQLDIERITYHEDQRYMEDYFFTLQIFTKENADWDSLAENFYVGDYIHSVNQAHTLAFTNEAERQMILADPEYIICWERINDIRQSLIK